MTRTGERRPLSRPRSTWDTIPAPPLPSTVAPAAWRRRVHDGTLTAFLTRDPDDHPAGTGLWHLSISHQPNNPRHAQRYPTWDEIADARDQLTDPHIEFHMILPPAGEYVAIHDTTFHLHEAR